MTGILYRQFALTIVVSMGLSAFVALTLTPVLCEIILKPHEHGKKNFFSKFFDAFNNWFERTKNSYVGIVAKVIAGKKFKDVISVAGYDIVSIGTKSSSATFFISMYSWAERTDFEKSVTAAIENVFLVGNGIAPEGFVMEFNPPALPGLGQVGGLTMQLSA